jgi:hypothetical protein
MSRPVIALTDHELVETIQEMAKRDYRSRTKAMKMLIGLGLASYARTGSLNCLGRPWCRISDCLCRKVIEPGDGERGRLLGFPGSPA